MSDLPLYNAWQPGWYKAQFRPYINILPPQSASSILALAASLDLRLKRPCDQFAFPALYANKHLHHWDKWTQCFLCTERNISIYGMCRVHKNAWNVSICQRQSFTMLIKFHLSNSKSHAGLYPWATKVFILVSVNFIFWKSDMFHSMNVIFSHTFSVNSEISQNWKFRCSENRHIWLTLSSRQPGAAALWQSNTQGMQLNLMHLILTVQEGMNNLEFATAV